METAEIFDLPRSNDKEELLVAWFKETFAVRTPPKSIMDAHPDVIC